MLKLKLMAIVLTVAVAGTASAGWRNMRVEAANAASFEESVAAFEKELSTARHYVFMLALQDIWAQGLQRATAEHREYTEAEYGSSTTKASGPVPLDWTQAHVHFATLHLTGNGPVR